MKKGENVVYLNEDLTNKASKARAAAELGIAFKKVGHSHETAAENATHELSHAIEHRGSGTMKVVDKQGMLRRHTLGVYIPDSPRDTPLVDWMQIYEAPKKRGCKLSGSDTGKVIVLKTIKMLGLIK